jgi:putative endonuclease
VEGFTEKYNVVRLVYFEQFDDPENAIDLYPGIAGA